MSRLYRWRKNLSHLPRDVRDTLFLLVVIGWVVLPQTVELPLWCSLLIAAVLLWRGWLSIKGQPLPSPWWRRALLLGVVAGVYFSHRTLLGQEAGTTLVVALLALKTLELRARRDALAVFFLGFFVLLTNFFHSQSLPLAMAMLIGLWGLLTALVNAHRPVGRPSLRESAGMAVRMMLGGAPLMLALFMFFPRFAPLWGLPSDAVGKSGLSSSMEVGNMAQLAQDESIAMRVRFDSTAPPQRELYFRGAVLSHFDGRFWHASSRGSALDINPASGPGDLRTSGAAIGYQVTLEPSHLPWVMTLDIAPEAPDLPPGMYVRMTADMQWVSPQPLNDLLRYHARSHTQFSYGLQGSPRPDQPAGNASARRPDLSRYLRLPSGFDPRTQALAKSLREQTGGDPVALVQAALKRLSTGDYTYTLQPGVYGQHTADEFWFDRRRGFCEHIASAFVILLRGAGLPARIVTGFQGGEINKVDGYWIVRNSDAHAWAEVWLPERGWVRIDPTAAISPGRIERFDRLRAPEGAITSALGSLSPGLLTQLRHLWDAVDNSWNQWVLNYTQTRQFDLLKKLGFSSPDWQDLAKVLGVLVALAALGGIAWAWWERSRQDPWLRLLARARQRMAKAGLPVQHATTPRALWRLLQASAQQGADGSFGLRQDLGNWLLAMERLRYAPVSDAAVGDAAATSHASSPAASAGDGRAKGIATLARQWHALQTQPWPKPGLPSD